jgi:hypothetical protein
MVAAPDHADETDHALFAVLDEALLAKAASRSFCAPTRSALTPPWSRAT